MNRGSPKSRRLHRRPWNFSGILPAAVIIAILVPACSEEDFRHDIEAVRAARTIAPDATNDEVARRIAGAQGRIAWTAGRIGEYLNYENTVSVIAHIDRKTRAGADRAIELTFLYDRALGDVSFQLLGVDGQSMMVMGDWLQLLLAE